MDSEDEGSDGTPVSDRMEEVNDDGEDPSPISCGGGPRRPRGDRKRTKRPAWSREEEQLLVQKHASLGNCWSTIAQYLKGRTPMEVKNCFYSTTRAVRVCQRSLLLAYVRALGDDGSDPVKRREAFEAAQRVMAEEHAKDQGAGGSAAASSGPASSRPTLRSSLSGRSARHLPRQARAAQGAGRAGGGSNSREQSGSVSNICSELPATQQPSKQQQQQQHDASHNTLLASAMMVDGGSLAGLLNGGSEQALGHSRGLSLSRRQSARLPDAPPLAAEGSLGQPLASAGLFDGGGGAGGDGDLGPRIPDMAAYKRACWSMPGRTSATLIQDTAPGEDLQGAPMSTDGSGPAAGWGDRVGSAGAAGVPPGSFAGSGPPREDARPGSEPMLPAYLDRPSPCGLRPPLRTSAWGAHQHQHQHQHQRTDVVLEPENSAGVPFSPFAAAARTAELLSLRHGSLQSRPQPPLPPKGLQLAGSTSYGNGSVGTAGPPSSGHGHSHAASGVAPMDEGSSYSLGFAASPARAAMQARAAAEHAHGPFHQQLQQRQGQTLAAAWSAGARDTGPYQPPHGTGAGMPQGQGQTVRYQPEPMPCPEDVDRARSAPNLCHGASLPFAHGRGSAGPHSRLGLAALGDCSAGQRGPAASQEHSPWQQQQQHPNLGHLRQEGSETMSCGVEAGAAQPWGSSLMSPSSQAGAYDLAVPPMHSQQLQQQQHQGGPGSASSRPGSTHSLCSNLSQQGLGEPWAQPPAPDAVAQQPGQPKVPWSAPPPPPFNRSVGLDPDVSVCAYAALTPSSRASLDAPRGSGAAQMPLSRASLDAPRGPGAWPLLPGGGGASQGPPLGFSQQQQQERQGSAGQMQGALSAFGLAGGGGGGGAPAGKLKQQPSIGSRRPGSSLQTLHEERDYDDLRLLAGSVVHCPSRAATLDRPSSDTLGAMGSTRGGSGRGSSFLRNHSSGRLTSWDGPVSQAAPPPGGTMHGHHGSAGGVPQDGQAMPGHGGQQGQQLQQQHPWHPGQQQQQQAAAALVQPRSEGLPPGAQLRPQVSLDAWQGEGAASVPRPDEQHLHKEQQQQQLLHNQLQFQQQPSVRQQQLSQLYSHGQSQPRMPWMQQAPLGTEQQQQQQHGRPQEELLDVVVLGLDESLMSMIE